MPRCLLNIKAACRTELTLVFFFLFWDENSYLFPIFGPLTYLFSYFLSVICHLTPWHWHKLFTEVIDLHTPLKKKLVRGNTVSKMTPEIIQAINTRNRLRRKFTKSKTSENWEAYRKQPKFVTSLKRSALKSYCIYVSTKQYVKIDGILSDWQIV